MPVVATPNGWVRVAAEKKSRPSKPVDPLERLRGPLAYITGRPDIKGPVKRQPVPLFLERTPKSLRNNPRTPPRLPSPVVEHEPARANRPRSRIPSAPAVLKPQRAPTGSYEEAEEGIPKPHLDARSQRSASPVGDRHYKSDALDSSRRHRARTHREDDDRSFYRGHRHQDDEDEYAPRRERRHHRRVESDYYPQSAAQNMQTLQPIIIYATPPATPGCNGSTGCQSISYQSRAALPAPYQHAPKPAPSVISSASSDSRASRAMSYQWYTATQPLKM